MLTRDTIRRELTLIDSYRHDERLSEDQQKFLYGAATALSWALGEPVMKPSNCEPLPFAEARKGRVGT